MLSEKLIRYPPYNLHTTEIHKCSTLYCLEPIGIGTPSCESLTSYLIRLADVHCVSLDKLIKHKIYPIFWSHNDLCTYSKGIVGRTFTHHSHLKSLNFSGWYASKLVWKKIAKIVKISKISIFRKIFILYEIANFRYFGHENDKS